MNARRLYNSMAVLAAAVVFAVPTSSAFAEMLVDPVAAAPPAVSLSRANRDAYFTAKEAQLERLDFASLRAVRSARPARLSTAPAAAATYADMKARQMDRMLNGE